MSNRGAHDCQGCRRSVPTCRDICRPQGRRYKYQYLWPPLRERKETIPNLIKLFIHKDNELLDKNISRILSVAEAILANYDYPGNVRELENIIEHAVVLAESGEITEKDLPEIMLKEQAVDRGQEKSLSAGKPLRPEREDIESLETIERTTSCGHSMHCTITIPKPQGNSGYPDPRCGARYANTSSTDRSLWTPLHPSPSEMT